MLSARRKAQGFTIAINPAFPQFQLIATTDPKLTNTLLSTTFTAVKIEKCHRVSAITKTLSTPQTLSLQIPLTT